MIIKEIEPYCLNHQKFRCKCVNFQFMKYFTIMFSYSKYLDFMENKNNG